MRYSKSPLILALFLSVKAWAGPAETHAPHKIPGAGTFHACHYCHSLKEGIHLTGPSLANLWGKKAGTAAGFDQYTDALKKSGIVWDEKTMKKWLMNPDKLVKGTTMKLKVHYSDHTVDRAIAFLKIAMGPDGLKRVIDEELEEANVAEGQHQQDVSKPSKKEIVTEIQHCKSTVTLKYADGHSTKHWEMNINYKTDTSARGPQPGKPVLVETGSLGDRFQIVFRSAEEIRTMVKNCP